MHKDAGKEKNLLENGLAEKKAWRRHYSLLRPCSLNQKDYAIVSWSCKICFATIRQCLFWECDNMLCNPIKLNIFYTFYVTNLNAEKQKYWDSFFLSTNFQKEVPPIMCGLLIYNSFNWLLKTTLNI